MVILELIRALKVLTFIGRDAVIRYRTNRGNPLFGDS